MTHDEREPVGSESPPHIDEETCTDILAALLPATEAETILDHVSDCEMCERVFVARVAEHEILRASDQPCKDASGRWRLPSQEHTAKAVENRASLWTTFRTWLTPARTALTTGTAALAILLVFVLMPTQQTTTPEYWIPGGREFRNIRSSPTQVDERFREGLVAYDARNLPRAIELLEGAAVAGSYIAFRQIYLASALSLSGKHAAALQQLDTLDTDRIPQPWRAESQWIRYIAMVNSSGKKAAEPLLDQLLKMEGEVGNLARKEKRRLTNQ